MPVAPCAQHHSHTRAGAQGGALGPWSSGSAAYEKARHVDLVHDALDDLRLLQHALLVDALEGVHRARLDVLHQLEHAKRAIREHRARQQLAKVGRLRLVAFPAFLAFLVREHSGFAARRRA
eukprot:3556721-Prymnesium_polylepis.1